MCPVCTSAEAPPSPRTWVVPDTAFIEGTLPKLDKPLAVGLACRQAVLELISYMSILSHNLFPQARAGAVCVTQPADSLMAVLPCCMQSCAASFRPPSRQADVLPGRMGCFPVTQPVGGGSSSVSMPVVVVLLALEMSAAAFRDAK